MQKMPCPALPHRALTDVFRPRMQKRYARAYKNGMRARAYKNGIRTRARKKLSDGSDEILESLKQGHVTYVINTQSHSGSENPMDGILIRRHAVEHNVTMFTSLDTVSVLLDVLEEITVGVSTIDM